MAHILYILAYHLQTDADPDPQHCICTVVTSVANSELLEGDPSLKSKVWILK